MAVIFCFFGCESRKEEINENNPLNAEVSGDAGKEVSLPQSENTPEENEEELITVGNNTPEEVPNEAPPFFQAEIIDISDGEITVKPLEGWPEGNYAEKIRISTQNVAIEGELKNGYVVQIFYSGMMTEEDPPAAAGVSKIEFINFGSTITVKEIIDITERDGLSTGAALEEFWKNDKYTFFFPSIKSEYIICVLSNGEEIKIKDALEKGIVTTDDLYAAGISFYQQDENGNITGMIFN